MINIYKELDVRIKNIIDEGKRIAIYPFGDIGFQAWQIARWRYGQKDIICIDNGISNYNEDVITFSEFKEMDHSDIKALICVEDMSINQHFSNQMKDLGIPNENILRPYPLQNEEREEYFRQIKNLLIVKKTSNIDLVRVGRERDGGYIMPSDYLNVSKVFSFGIGKEVSFDKVFADDGIDVFCFDHTIPDFPIEHAHLHWVRKGIGSRDVGQDLISMKEALNLYSGNDNNMLIKMDVEGAEWDFLESVNEDILSRFRIMTFELHGLLMEERQERIIHCFNLT